MASFQRARKPEHKEVRRQAVLSAARELAQKDGPLKLSLNQLGRLSGVSKPNIYRYFESREEVLIHLLIGELEEIVASIESSLSSSNLSVASVASRISREYLARPLLCRLLGMASAILEHNLSVQAIAIAKALIRKLSARMAAAVTRALPWLGETDALWAVHTIAIYVAGMWPAAHPSAAAAEVLSRPEFVALKIDPARDLIRFTEVLLAGLQSRSSDKLHPAGSATLTV